MANPPVPPRPQEYASARYDTIPPPPPLPPVPPTLKFEIESEFGSRPHLEDPLVAPRPHRLQPDLPANMARNLNEQASSSYPRGSLDYGGGRSPQPTYNPTPGFAMPSSLRGPSPAPPSWDPWSAASSPPPSTPAQLPSPYQRSSYTPQPPYSPQPPRQDDVAASIAALSLTPSLNQHHHSNHHHHQRTPTSSSVAPSPPQVQQQQQGAVHQRHHSASVSSMPPPARSQPQSSPNAAGPPSLTAPLPTIAGLTAQLSAVRQPGYDPIQQVVWCRDVLSLVNRAESLQSTAANVTSVSADVPIGPVRIGDPQLQRLVDVAIPIILEISSPNPVPKPTPTHVSEAIYLKATCEASGAYPQYVRRDPRTAFRDFEYAARHGYPAAWFRIGRDYENFGDIAHARDAFERGVKAGDERCLYRMGMANLMGQLGLPPSAEAALPLLNRAATLATVDVPQPAYVYGLLLLAEFSHISIPPRLFDPYIPAGSNPQAEARKHLERAAYLNFAPAQYKLGHSYEFATSPFPFDALLSVQYYSLASQQGEIEADMALSKWFLCGSEGAFDKDESLAWTFAEKAARKGLPSAEFAMGYYAEVGVGGPKDIDGARKWYKRAADHGNQDAKDRLAALSQPSPQALSRTEHDHLTESKLVRSRTQAKQRSDAAGARPPPMPAAQGARIVEKVRQNSMMRPPPVSMAAASPSTVPLGSYPEEPQSLSSVHPDRPLSNNISPRQRPTELPTPKPIAPLTQARPFANAPRYTLADPGPGSAVGVRPSASPPIVPPSRRPNVDDPRSDAAAPPKRGPQTFAEMGIVTAKVEEKDCVIM